MIKENDNLLWKSDIGCVSLNETNVKMSGNIKTIFTDKNIIGIESISSNDTLSNLNLKGFVCDKSLSYFSNLVTFMQEFKDKDSLHFIKQAPIEEYTRRLTDQIDNIYRYGCHREITDMFNKEGLRFFAPLFIYDKIPDRFIIYRVDDTTKVDIKNPFNLSKVVKSFDLTINSDFGKYIRTLTENRNFRKWQVGFDLDDGYKFCSLNPYSGIMKLVEVDNINSFLANERTITEFDNYLTNLWEQSLTISPNLLNLEFSFEDKSAPLGFNSYIGVYAFDNEYDENKAYDKRSLLITQNLTDSKRFEIPRPTDPTWIENDSNIPIEPSRKLLGSCKHLVDTEFDLPLPMVCIDFLHIPSYDTFISIEVNNKVEFFLPIYPDDIKSTIALTLSELAFKAENIDLNTIGVYGESYFQNGKGTLVLYIPTYLEDNIYKIKIPDGAVLHVSSTGKQVFYPSVRDALVMNYVKSADSFYIDGIEYDIEEAYMRYDNNYYLRHNCPSEIIDNYNSLSLYLKVPIEYKLLKPLVHARFQKDRYDLHYNMIDFDKESYMKYFADTLIKIHNDGLSDIDPNNDNRIIPENTTLKQIAEHNVTQTVNLPGVGNVTSDTWDPEKQIAIELMDYFDSIPDNLTKEQFIENINLELMDNLYPVYNENGIVIDFRPKYIENPYNRLIELDFEIKNINKRVTFINKFANPFGMDSTMLPYTANISLTNDVNNFVALKEKLRNLRALTHNWYILANGYGYQTNQRKCSSYFNSEYWYKNPSKNRTLYRETALSIVDDFYKGLIQKCDTSDNLYREYHSWVNMELMDGFSDMYFAFFMGIEYRFQGNYKGYRFSVIFTSENKIRDKNYEFIDNAYFKTLTLFIYAYIPDQLLTTLNGKLPYYLDRSILYYADKPYNGTGSELEFFDSDKMVVSFFDTLESHYFANTITPKLEYNVNSDNSHLYDPSQIVNNKVSINSWFYTILDENNERIPIFYVNSEDLVINDEFTKIIDPEKPFSWFMLYEDGVNSTKIIKFTAHNIVELKSTYFWCKDITMEFFPQGVPGIDETTSLWKLVEDNFPGVDSISFYNDIITNSIPYIDNIGPVADSPNTPHVRSLKQDFWMELPENFIESSWIQDFIVTVNNKKFICFRDFSDKNIYLLDKDKSLLEHSNVWYMGNQISKSECFYMVTSNSGTQNKYEELSFSILYSLLTSGKIDYSKIFYTTETIIGLNGEPEIIEVPVNYEYKKEINIDDNKDSIIIVSLKANNDKTNLIRTDYIEFPIKRYNTLYAPIFEKLLWAYSDNLEKEYIPIFDKSQYRYIQPYTLLVNEKYLKYDSNLFLNLNENPYFAKDNYDSIWLPYSVNPVDVNSYISSIFNYYNEFYISGESINGIVDLYESLYQYMINNVLTQTQKREVEELSDVYKTLAFKPDALDMLPENTYTYDLLYIIFKRFFNDNFSKYWIVKKVSDNNNKEYDFTQMSNEVILNTSTYNGILKLKIALK